MDLDSPKSEASGHSYVDEKPKPKVSRLNISKVSSTGRDSLRLNTPQAFSGRRGEKVNLKLPKIAAKTNQLFSSVANSSLNLTKTTSVIDSAQNSTRTHSNIAQLEDTLFGFSGDDQDSHDENDPKKVFHTRAKTSMDTSIISDGDSILNYDNQIYSDNQKLPLNYLYKKFEYEKKHIHNCAAQSTFATIENKKQNIVLNALNNASIPTKTSGKIVTVDVEELEHVHKAFETMENEIEKTIENYMSRPMSQQNNRGRNKIKTEHFTETHFHKSKKEEEREKLHHKINEVRKKREYAKSHHEPIQKPELEKTIVTRDIIDRNIQNASRLSMLSSEDVADKIEREYGRHEVILTKKKQLELEFMARCQATIEHNELVYFHRQQERTIKKQQRIWATIICILRGVRAMGSVFDVAQRIQDRLRRQRERKFIAINGLKRCAKMCTVLNHWKHKRMITSVHFLRAFFRDMMHAQILPMAVAKFRQSVVHLQRTSRKKTIVTNARILTYSICFDSHIQKTLSLLEVDINRIKTGEIKDAAAKIKAKSERKEELLKLTKEIKSKIIMQYIKDKMKEHASRLHVWYTGKSQNRKSIMDHIPHFFVALKKEEADRLLENALFVARQKTK